MIEPTKRTLHNPTSGLYLKALLIIGAQDDFNVDANLCRTGNESTAISRIGPDFSKARVGLKQSVDQPTSDSALLPACFRDKRFEHQTFGVDNQVSFASFDVFARIIASTAPFSVVLTDWLSMMAALGVASRPSSWRRSSRTC